jgi:hypothetical protein
MMSRYSYEFTITLDGNNGSEKYVLRIKGDSQPELYARGITNKGLDIRSAVKMFVQFVCKSNAVRGKFFHVDGDSTNFSGSDWEKPTAYTAGESLLNSIKEYWFSPRFTCRVNASRAMNIGIDELKKWVDEAAAEVLGVGEKKNQKKRAHEEDKHDAKMAKRSENEVPNIAHEYDSYDEEKESDDKKKDDSIPHQEEASAKYLSVCALCENIEYSLGKILSKAEDLHAYDVFKPYVRMIRKNVAQLRDGPMTEEEYSALSDSEEEEEE